MVAVYATATVVVTVAAGTWCAWYGVTGPLDAEKSPPGPGTCTAYVTGSYTHLEFILVNFINFWGTITVSVGKWSHVEILTHVWTWGGHPPDCGCPGYPLPCLGVIEPPLGSL